MCFTYPCLCTRFTNSSLLFAYALNSKFLSSLLLYTGSHESIERFQYPQDLHGGCPYIHGSNWWPVPCSQCSQKEGTWFWGLRQEINAGMLQHCFNLISVELSVLWDLTVLYWNVLAFVLKICYNYCEVMQDAAIQYILLLSNFACYCSQVFTCCHSTCSQSITFWSYMYMWCCNYCEVLDCCIHIIMPRGGASAYCSSFVIPSVTAVLQRTLKGEHWNLQHK